MLAQSGRLGNLTPRCFRTLLAAGAIVAWCATEGCFSANLFDSAEMNCIYAAMTRQPGFHLSAYISQEFKYLDTHFLTELKSFLKVQTGR